MRTIFWFDLANMGWHFVYSRSELKVFFGMATLFFGMATVIGAPSSNFTKWFQARNLISFSMGFISQIIKKYNFFINSIYKIKGMFGVWRVYEAINNYQNGIKKNSLHSLFGPTRIRSDILLLTCYFFLLPC